MKILIIEDEARIARRIARMIRQILGQDITSLLLCDSLEKGLATINNESIDLLFLDLNLNGEDGFDILETVVAESFHTIIISAYKDRALRAFEYGVLDFVPKPFDEKRLAKACQRIVNKTAGITDMKYVAIKKKGKQVLIKVEDILYVKGAGIYTELFLQNGKQEIHNKSLERLQTLLPATYERIHKSYLVAMNHAKQIVIEPGSKYSMELQNGTCLPIGRTRYKNIQEKWFA